MLAGEAGGVDSWGWWGESIEDFINSYNEGNQTNFKYMIEIFEDYVNSYETITREEE